MKRPLSARLRLLLEAGLERLALCEAGRVLAANDAFASFLGRSPDELRDAPLAHLLTFTESAEIDPNTDVNGAPVVLGATVTLRGGERVPAEVALRSLTVGRRTVQIIALRDPGDPQAALRRYQAELARKDRELARANRVQREFLATVSHELRTPLTSVVGYAQLLEDDPTLSAEARGYLAQIGASGVQLAALVEGLIDLSRLESGDLALYRERLTFGETVTRVLTKVQPDAAAKGIALRVLGDPDVTLSADPVRLEQILLSYLSNAVKFTPLGGSVTVTLSADADELRCEVVDDGVGVSADDLPHVFQPFFRVDGLEGRSETGAGLGLALVKRLTELHGGRVWAESAPGRGSRFGFALPRGAAWQADRPVQSAYRSA